MRLPDAVLRISPLRSIASTFALSRRKLSVSAPRSSKPSADFPTKPRISPYRLVPAQTFISEFAPLHTQGWRLSSLENGMQSSERPTVGEGGDLQDHELVRTYEFEMTKEGWKRAIQLVMRVGEVVDKHDHHPKILICPSGDLPRYLKADTADLSGSAGYAVQVSTHTHTPLPPPPTGPSSITTPAHPGTVAPSGALSDAGSGQVGAKARMRPGVTTKDLRLARAVEDIWTEL